MPSKADFEEFEQTFNLVSYIKARTPYTTSGKGVLILCPFHQESTPSMYVTKNRAYCFGCGASYGSAEFLHVYANLTYSDILNVPRPQEKTQIEYPTITVNPRFIERAHKTLLLSISKLRYLIAERKLSLSVIKKYKIGYARPPFRKYIMPRYVFPAWDCNETLATAAYRQDPNITYEDKYPENKKYVIHTGTQAIPYALDSLDNSADVVYCGGQIDALSLLQYNIPAIGAMGEGTFKSSWATLFDNHRVFILLDNDSAGKLAARKVHDKLENSIILDWPDGVPNKYDVNSAIIDKGFGINGIRRMLAGVGFNA